MQALVTDPDLVAAAIAGGTRQRQSARARRAARRRAASRARWAALVSGQRARRSPRPSAEAAAAAAWRDNSYRRARRGDRHRPRPRGGRPAPLPAGLQRRRRGSSRSRAKRIAGAVRRCSEERPDDDQRHPLSPDQEINRQLALGARDRAGADRDLDRQAHPGAVGRSGRAPRASPTIGRAQANEAPGRAISTSPRPSPTRADTRAEGRRHRARPRAPS